MKRITNPWNLTEPQCEVARRLFQVVNYKAIARELGIPPTAVNSRLNEIFERMGVRSKTQAAVLWDRYERSNNQGAQANG